MLKENRKIKILKILSNTICIENKLILKTSTNIANLLHSRQGIGIFLKTKVILTNREIPFKINHMRQYLSRLTNCKETCLCFFGQLNCRSLLLNHNSKQLYHSSWRGTLKTTIFANKESFLL